VGSIDYTPYEGIEVTGWPVMTMLRGATVVDHGQLVAAKGCGTFLPRTAGLPGSAAP
jgi:dihydropyrimidinase